MKQLKRFKKGGVSMEYELSQDEMLDLLSDLVQSSSVYGDQEQDLLNFIEEIREQQAND